MKNHLHLRSHNENHQSYKKMDLLNLPFEWVLVTQLSNRMYQKEKTTEQLQSCLPFQDESHFSAHIPEIVPIKDMIAEAIIAKIRII